MTRSIRYILAAFSALLTLIITGASTPLSHEWDRVYADYTVTEMESTAP